MSARNDTSARNFEARSTALEVIEGHDLSGREAIVTGGASGIGVETVRVLALAGARVIIATRDAAKGEAVAATLRKETQSDKIEFRSLDLVSLRSVKSFVADFLRLRSELHLLINNAGIWQRHSPAPMPDSNRSLGPITSATFF